MDPDLQARFDLEERVESGRPMSLWFKSVLDQLRDGRWHDRDAVTAQAATQVPPGRAWRIVEARRRQQKERRLRASGMNDEEVENWFDTHDFARQTPPEAHSWAIISGQRSLVNDHINRSPRVERKTVNGRRLIRRIPLSDDTLRRRGFYPQQKGGEADYMEE